MKRIFPSCRQQSTLDEKGRADPVSVTALITRIVCSKQPRARDLAAAELNDLLEALEFDDGLLRAVADSLVELALTESDPATRESLFNALSTASMKGRFDVNRIAGELNRLDRGCLEHALVTLGFSGEPRYRDCIRPFLKSADPQTRQTAAEAIVELDAVRGRKRQK